MASNSEPRKNQKVLRRLAAMLAADIAGYSALMGTNEARTVRDLREGMSAALS
jgi:class 3 adenylate cyclase